MSGLRQRKGLTLIELLVMLTIVVIMALIAIPVFNSVVQYYRVTSAAQQLYSAMQLARSEAVKQNTNIYMNVNTGTSWCYGFNVGSACSCQTSGSCNLGSYSATGPNLLTLSATGLSGGSIYFKSLHGGVSSVATFTFTVYGQSTLITTSISLLGSISTCSTGVNGYTAC